jgi:hypothetical protein
MLQRVLVDKAIELLCEFAGHFGRAARARAIHETQGALVRKAIDPLTQGRIRKVERVGDGLEPLACDDGADRLGTAEDTRFFRLFQEGI